MALLMYDRKWRRCRKIIKLFKYDDDPREIFPPDLSVPFRVHQKGFESSLPFFNWKGVSSRIEIFLTSSN